MSVYLSIRRLLAGLLLLRDPFYRTKRLSRHNRRNMQADWNFHLSGSANLFSRPSASKFWFSLALSISLCVVVSHGALSSGEKEVLSTLLSVFPNLGFIPASQFVIDSNIDYGSSWTSNFDALCLGSDGYEYYGLYCGSGRISGLVMYVTLNEVSE